MQKVREKSQSGKCVLISVCVRAYVLRLPYTLLPVLAVKTLLSIS